MSPARPNILLITSDQQHWNTLGCLNPEVQTPNLDRLVGEGTLFTRAYCPNPTCTPTRSSIITGLYPSQHGAWSLGTKLDEGVHTVGEDFTGAGYRTGLVGKAHFQPLQGTAEYPSLESYPILQDLDFWRAFDQPFYGFEDVRLARNHADEAHVGQHYAIWMEEKGCDNWRDYYRPPTGNNTTQKHKWLIPEQFHYNTWIAEETGHFLQGYRDRGEAFFLWSSFFDPHPPYLVPEPWDTMYDPTVIEVPQITPGEHDDNPPHFGMTQEEKPDFSPWRQSGFGMHGFSSHLHERGEMAKNIAVYYGMISMMDHYIGRILDRLEELGLADNTLVVFTSDHGHFFGQHGLSAKGAFHYEDLIRVPLVARWSGQIEAGQRSEAIQSLVDLAPTFLGACQIEGGETMAGVDQSKAWRGRAGPGRDHAVVENRHEATSIHHKTFVDQRYKLTVYYQRPYGDLFDLQEDPGEVRNLWNSALHAQLRAALTAKMLDAELGKEPLTMPRIAGA